MGDSVAPQKSGPWLLLASSVSESYFKHKHPLLFSLPDAVRSIVPCFVIFITPAGPQASWGQAPHLTIQPTVQEGTSQQAVSSLKGQELVLGGQKYVYV